MHILVAFYVFTAMALPLQWFLALQVTLHVPYVLLTGGLARLGSSKDPYHTGRREWPPVQKWATEYMQLMGDLWLGGVRVIRDGKPARLPAGTPRVFGYHPHGLYPLGAGFLPYLRTFQKLFPDGRRPVTLTANAMFYPPLLRDVMGWAGARRVSRRTLEKALCENGSVLLVPGGQQELVYTYRAHRDRDPEVVLSTRWVRQSSLTPPRIHPRVLGGRQKGTPTAVLVERVPETAAPPYLLRLLGTRALFVWRSSTGRPCTQCSSSARCLGSATSSTCPGCSSGPTRSLDSRSLTCWVEGKGRGRSRAARLVANMPRPRSMPLRRHCLCRWGLLPSPRPHTHPVTFVVGEPLLPPGLPGAMDVQGVAAEPLQQQKAGGGGARRRRVTGLLPRRNRPCCFRPGNQPTLSSLCQAGQQQRRQGEGWRRPPASTDQRSGQRAPECLRAPD